MNIIFFAYRDWAIDIFKYISSPDNRINANKQFQYVLFTDKKSCNKEFLDAFNPTLILFYGWSWMVPKKIVDTYDCICLHPSPLPLYRGGSPIQNQIQNSETDSRVSLFKMDEGMDTGPVYPMSYHISLMDPLNIIFDNIRIGGEMLTTFMLEDLLNGDLKFSDQGKGATTFKRLKPEDSEIKPQDFLKHNASFLYNKIRSLEEPYPECFIKCKTGKIIFKNVDYKDD